MQTLRNTRQLQHRHDAPLQFMKPILVCVQQHLLAPGHIAKTQMMPILLLQAWQHFISTFRNTGYVFKIILPGLLHTKTYKPPMHLQDPMRSLRVVAAV